MTVMIKVFTVFFKRWLCGALYVVRSVKTNVTGWSYKHVISKKVLSVAKLTDMCTVSVSDGVCASVRYFSFSSSGLMCVCY